MVEVVVQTEQEVVPWVEMVEKELEHQDDYIRVSVVEREDDR